VNVR